MSERTSTSTSTRFRPAPVGSVLDGTADHGAERARAAGWSAGWAAGARAAGAAAMGQRRALDDAQVASERARSAQVEAALAVLRRATEAVSARTVPVLVDAARALDDGAVTLAAALLGCGLADTDDRARAALTRALSLPLDVGVDTVRVHPMDLEVLVRVGAAAHLPVGVALVADPGLMLGDAVSDFPGGYLDARIGAAVERARRALEEQR